MIITILCLVGGAITVGDRSGILSLQSISETHFCSCMLHLGKSYQPVSEMSEVTDLLKAWMEETHKQELRHEEERRRYEQERAEEKRHYEQERAEERLRYEELVRGLTTGRPHRVEVGPESLKLTKLGETDDIKAFLTTFERAVEAHGVERDKRAAILAPQLTGKARLPTRR